MKYMGSKRRIAKNILPVMLSEFEKNNCTTWVEPFVGGANMLDKVPKHIPRIGADIHEELVEFFKYLQTENPEIPFVGEDLYKHIQKNKTDYPKWLVGYVGFSLSFGGKWFGGYRRDKAGVRNYENESQQNVQAQQNVLADVKWVCSSYDSLDIPANSLIYCDPPYRDTTGYKNKFSHDAFYVWCRNKKKEGHTVFVSEYWMPDDFTCVWEKEIVSSLTKDTGSKKGTERLFKL